MTVTTGSCGTGAGAWRSAASSPAFGRWPIRRRAGTQARCDAAPQPILPPTRRQASTRSTWPITMAAPKRSSAAWPRCVPPMLRSRPIAPSPNGAPSPGPMTPAVVRAGCRARLPAHGHRSHRPHAVPLVDVRAPGLSRRDARIGQAQGRRADRQSGRHQFQHRSSARTGEVGHPHRHQPGVLFAARSPRHGRHVGILPRERHQAPRLWHARRRLPVGSLAWCSRARRYRRLEQDEIWPLHRRDRRLAGLADNPQRGFRDRRQTRRIDRQCRDPLGACSSRRSPP